MKSIEISEHSLCFCYQEAGCKKTMHLITPSGASKQGTSLTVVLQFLKLLAVDNYAQPVDNPFLCHRMSGWAWSDAGFFVGGPTSWNSTLLDCLCDPTL